MANMGGIGPTGGSLSDNTCEDVCGAKPECDERKIGDPCGSNGVCDDNCVCIEENECSYDWECDMCSSDSNWDMTFCPGICQGGTCSRDTCVCKAGKCEANCDGTPGNIGCIGGTNNGYCYYGKCGEDEDLTTGTCQCVSAGTCDEGFCRTGDTCYYGVKCNENSGWTYDNYCTVPGGGKCDVSGCYDTCTDDCDELGKTYYQCTNNILQKRVCDNIDSDSCNDWQTSTWLTATNCMLRNSQSSYNYCGYGTCDADEKPSWGCSATLGACFYTCNPAAECYVECYNDNDCGIKDCDNLNNRCEGTTWLDYEDCQRTCVSGSCVDCSCSSYSSTPNSPLCPPDCECSSGPCCDGCDIITDTTEVCSSESEFICQGGSGCGNDIDARYRDRYCSGTGTSSLCTGSFSIWSDYTFYRSCDNSQMCKDGQAMCVADAACADIEAPVTSMYCNGADCLNCWYNRDVSISFTCSDNEGSCSRTEYCLGSSCDPDIGSVYSSAFNLPEGTNYVRYFSTDPAGNEETTRSRTIKIDKSLGEQTIQTTIRASYLGADKKSIQLSYSVSPSNPGISVSFGTNPITWPSATSVMTIEAEPGTPAGTYMIRVKGTSDELTIYAFFELSVTN